MTLDAIAGRTYGPFPVELSAAKVAELVAATGDDPGRWRDAAPPSYAANLLFAAAPAFFADEDVAAHSAGIIHSQQLFRWARPLRCGTGLEITGRVRDVRARAGLHFVAFGVLARDDHGPVVESDSTFIVAAGGAAGDQPEEEEPAWDARGASDAPRPVDVQGPGSELPPLRKSASRADLVRYAGASGDFNPIHWDHDAARALGLPGVVAHGLLMTAWLTQAGARLAPERDDPLAEMKVRFRQPLRPGRPAAVTARVDRVDDGAAHLDLAVVCDEAPLVTAAATVRSAAGR